MAVKLYNDFNFKTAGQFNKQEEKIDKDQLIAKLDEDIRRLKIEYGIYFNGGLKRPPHEARGRVEAQLKRITDDRKLTYAQRFLINNIVTRYTSYRELWRRHFKQRGELSF